MTYMTILKKAADAVYRLPSPDTIANASWCCVIVQPNRNRRDLLIKPLTSQVEHGTQIVRLQTTAAERLLEIDVK
ncbi:hypothetical protein RRG08_042544 [Elysia crispata]|uniref:Uncharacterized protein n=1 Tax=Elysia crispata TaxID=231223 RepID=A0AAE0XPV5_9GAST|nr:hypothetical protein RRG08_042544 [Elysia crispata]